MNFLNSACIDKDLVVFMKTILTIAAVYIVEKTCTMNKGVVKKQLQNVHCVLSDEQPI